MRLSCNLQCEQTERWESVVNSQARPMCFYLANLNYSVNVMCYFCEQTERIFGIQKYTYKHVTESDVLDTRNQLMINDESRLDEARDDLDWMKSEMTLDG